MLFISRQAGSNLFGVVDTDDGVEEIVSFGDICRYVSEYGIDIEGVSVEEFPFGRFVHDIDVYQPKDSLSRDQVRLQLLLNVSIVVYDSLITKITWNAEKMSAPVTIRLSDYGTRLGRNILVDNEISGSHKVTLILDDKLQFDADECTAFLFEEGFFRGCNMGRNGMGVVIDLSELSNDYVVSSIYEGLYRTAFNGDIEEMFGSVIDSEDSKENIREWLLGSDEDV